MQSCNKCSNNAFLKVDSGFFLCKECFSKRIESKVRKALSKYNMLKFGDHLAVGVSGGKDSIVLLTILSKIVHSKTQMTAIIVDEGVEGYRPHGIEIAIKTATKLNVPFKVVSYKSNFGFSLDEMIPIAPFGKSSCAICGTFRRKSLNQAALSISADVLATGHNLDDETESILLNVLRGDPIRFSRLSRSRESVSDVFVPRIKPLVEVSQPEIVYYAIANEIEYHDEVCPYANQARRNSIRDFLQNQEKNHPGTMKSMLSFHNTLLEELNHTPDVKSTLFTCQVCNEPTDSEKRICAGCKFLKEFNTKNES